MPDPEVDEYGVPILKKSAQAVDEYGVPILKKNGGSNGSNGTNGSAPSMFPSILDVGKVTGEKQTFTEEFETLTGYKKFDLGEPAPTSLWTERNKRFEEKKFKTYKKEQGKIDDADQKIHFGEISSEDITALQGNPYTRKLINDKIREYVPEVAGFSSTDLPGMGIETPEIVDLAARTIKEKNRINFVTAEKSMIANSDKDVASALGELNKRAENRDEKIHISDFNNNNQLSEAIQKVDRLRRFEQKYAILSVKDRREAGEKTGALLRQLNNRIFYNIGQMELPESVTKFSEQIEQAVLRKVIEDQRGDTVVDPEKDKIKVDQFKRGLAALEKSDPVMFKNVMRAIEEEKAVADSDFSTIGFIGQQVDNSQRHRAAAFSPELIDTETSFEYGTKGQKVAQASLEIGEWMKAHGHTNEPEFSETLIKQAAKELGIENKDIIDTIVFNEKLGAYDQIPKSGIIEHFAAGFLEPFEGIVSTINVIGESPAQTYLRSKELRSSIGTQKVADEDGNYTNKLPSDRKGWDGFTAGAFHGLGAFVPQIILTKGIGGGLGAVTARGLSSAKAVKNVADLGGTFVSTYLQTYGNAYANHLAKTGDVDKAQLMATIDGVSAAAFETLILPDVKIFDKAVAGLRGGLASDLMELVRKGGNPAELAKKARPFVTKFVTNTLDIAGQEVAEEVGTGIVDFITEAVFDPKSAQDRHLNKELWDITKSTFTAMILPAMLGGGGSALQKDFTVKSLHAAALNSESYKESLKKSLDNEYITQEEHDRAVKILDTHKQSLAAVPETNADGKKLTTQQEFDYAYEDTKIKVYETKAAATSGVAKEVWEQKIKAAQEVQREILIPKTTTDEKVSKAETVETKEVKTKTEEVLADEKVKEDILNKSEDELLQIIQERANKNGIPGKIESPQPKADVPKSDVVVGDKKGYTEDSYGNPLEPAQPKADVPIEGKPLWKNTETKFSKNADGDNIFNGKSGREYKITEQKGEATNDVQIYVYSKDNEKPIGLGHFKKNEDGTYSIDKNQTITVWDNHGKDGIARAMYDYMDNNHGKVKKSDTLTKQGEELWGVNQKNLTSSHNIESVGNEIKHDTEYNSYYFEVIKKDGSMIRRASSTKDEAIAERDKFKTLLGKELPQPKADVPKAKDIQDLQDDNKALTSTPEKAARNANRIAANNLMIDLLNKMKEGESIVDLLREDYDKKQAQLNKLPEGEEKNKKFEQLNKTNEYADLISQGIESRDNPNIEQYYKDKKAQEAEREKAIKENQPQPKADVPKEVDKEKRFPVGSMFIKKIVADGENTDLTERQQGSIEKAVQMAIDAGQSAEQIMGTLNGLGYAFSNPLSMAGATQSLKNYLEDRINGVDKRSITEFARNTRDIAETKTPQPKADVPKADALKDVESTTKALAPKATELFNESRSIKDTNGQDINIGDKILITRGKNVKGEANTNKYIVVKFNDNNTVEVNPVNEDGSINRNTISVLESGEGILESKWSSTYPNGEKIKLGDRVRANVPKYIFQIYNKDLTVSGFELDGSVKVKTNSGESGITKASLLNKIDEPAQPKADVPKAEKKEPEKKPERPTKQADEPRKAGKFETDARNLVDKGLPDWAKKINDALSIDPKFKDAKKGGLSAEDIEKFIGEAVIAVGRLMDKGVELAQAVKEVADKLIQQLKDAGHDVTDKIEKEIRTGLNKRKVGEHNGKAIYSITDADAFQKAIQEAMNLRQADRFQVGINSAEEYQRILDTGGKLYLSEDGKFGAYLQADGYMGSLFKSPDANLKGVAKVLQEIRVADGGRFLAAYGTHLEGMYVGNGFRPVARLRFNEEEAPKGWRDSNLKSRPDVVFFVYDPKGEYKVGDGQLFDDWDKAYIFTEEFNQTNEKTDTTTETGTEGTGEVNVADSPDVSTEGQAQRAGREGDKRLPDQAGADTGAGTTETTGTVKSKATQDFFAAVISGDEKYIPKAEWQPIIPIDDVPQNVKDVYASFNQAFDAHIAASVPVFKEVEYKKINAIVNILKEGSVLDIGGSEGSFGKTISALSGGKISTVNLDINPAMHKAFDKIPTPNAEYIEQSFSAPYSEDGVEYPKYVPEKKFDIVHEAFTIQFFEDKDRHFYVKEIKDNLLNPDGIVFLEQKVITPEYVDNEIKKDRDFKSKYFEQKDITEKAEKVLSGMQTGQAEETELETSLSDNFKHVYQFYDAGNFRGYLATNNKAKADEMLTAIGSTQSEFSNRNPLQKIVNGKPVTNYSALGKIKESYNKSHNITTVQVDSAKLSVPFFKEVADHHDTTPDDRNNPEVVKSYRAFMDETKAQYEALIAAGYTLEPFMGEGEPYGINSKAMIRDVVDNKHLFYLRSKSATGQGEENLAAEDYILFEPTGIVINGDKVVYNDLFRAVHDVLGHAKDGNTFSAQGEFNAYRNHSNMYSEAAQKALFLETLTYNAWYNYGKHLRNEAGEVQKDTARKYAPRKLYNVPDKFIDAARGTGLTDEDRANDLMDKEGTMLNVAGAVGVNAVFETRDGDPIGFNYDTDKVARERFDLSKLKKIGKGSDRTVFDLGNGRVLKVAHSARGLEQNIHEGGWLAGRITPEVYERGLNYVVAENVPRIKSRDAVNTYDPETGEKVGTTTATKMLEELQNFWQGDFDDSDSRLQDVLRKYGFQDILNYDVLYGDFERMANWGYKDGRAIHLDGGTFGGVEMITAYRGKKNMEDADFREVYNKSRAAKKKYGDTDRNTMFQIGGLGFRDTKRTEGEKTSHQKKVGAFMKPVITKLKALEGRVTVVRDAKEFNKELRKRGKTLTADRATALHAEGSAVGGVFLRGEGSDIGHIIINADHVRDAAGLKEILMEEAFHMGMRNVLGQEEMGRLADKVLGAVEEDWEGLKDDERSRIRGAERLASDYFGKTYKELKPWQRNEIAEELMWRIAKEKFSAEDVSIKNSGALRDMWEKIKSFIRESVTKLFGSGKTLSDETIHKIAANSIASLDHLRPMRQNEAGSKKDFKAVQELGRTKTNALSMAKVITGKERPPVIEGTGKPLGLGRRTITLKDVNLWFQNKFTGNAVQVGDRKIIGWKNVSQDVTSSIRVLNALYHEALSALANDGNAREWYRKTMKEMYAHLDAKFPEINEDTPEGKTAKMVFTSALAITSNGQDIKANFKNAAKAYRYYKIHKVFPTDFTYGGKSKGAMQGSFRTLNMMLEKMGAEKLHELMNRKMSVKELNELGEKHGGMWNLSGEKADHVVRGAMLMGAKIGAFYGNLNGRRDAITMDLWFTRTFNRLTGDSRVIDGEAMAKNTIPKLREHLEKIKSQLKSGSKEIQGLHTVLGDRLADKLDAALGDLDQWEEDYGAETGEAIDPETFWDNYPALHQFVMPVNRDYAKNKPVLDESGNTIPTKNDKGEDIIKMGSFQHQTSLKRAGKVLIEAVDGKGESPDNSAHREWMRGMLNKVREKLAAKGLEITNADLQAVLWFSEKDLYQNLGVGNIAAGANDYASAAKLFVEEEDNPPPEKAPKPEKKPKKPELPSLFHIVGTTARLSERVRYNANLAQKMEEEGYKPKEIHYMTGWIKGADSKWKYDSVDEVKIDYNKLQKDGDNLVLFEGHDLVNAPKLVDIVEGGADNVLFKEYPQLKDVVIGLQLNSKIPEMQQGAAAIVDQKVITINVNSFANANSFLAHELQHMIQAIEGFASGGNQMSIEIARGIVKDMEELQDRYKEAQVKGDLAEMREIVIDTRNIEAEHAAWAATLTNQERYEFYRRVAGEVEARNVQRRMRMTPAQRKNKSILDTQEFPNEEQNIQFIDVGGAFSLIPQAGTFSSEGVMNAIEEANAEIEKLKAEMPLDEAIQKGADIVVQYYKDSGIPVTPEIEQQIRDGFAEDYKASVPPPQPPTGTPPPTGSAGHKARLTAEFEAWKPVRRDKIIVQDVKTTDEERSGNIFADADYEREQMDKAASDVSIDILVRDALTNVQGGLAFLVDLVQNGLLPGSTQSGIMQSLKWRQGLPDHVVNNLSMIDKDVATESTANMMMRRMAGEEISQSQKDSIDSALGESGIATMEENLEAARADSQIPDEIQEEVSEIDVEEIQEEIKEEQKPAKPSAHRKPKIDKAKYKAKTEMMRTEMQKQPGDSFMKNLIANINKIAKEC